MMTRAGVARQSLRMAWVVVGLALGVAGNGAGAEEPAGTVRTFVIDGSFGMNFKSGDRTCFARAKEWVAKQIRGMGKADVCRVVVAAEQPEVVVTATRADGARALRAVRALPEPGGRMNLLWTLTELRRKRVGPDKARQELYFVTNMQAASWRGQSKRVGYLLRTLSADVPSVVVDVGKGGLRNTAVQDLAIEKPLFVPGETKELVALVHHYGDETRKDVPVELWGGKARATKDDPECRLKLLDRTVMNLKRGRNRVPFKYRFAAAGDYLLKVRLPADDLEADNAYSTVLRLHRRVPVLVVDGNAGAKEKTETASLYLTAALEASNPKGVELIRPRVLSPKEFAAGAAAGGKGLGETPACIFLCDVPRLGADEVRYLDGHLRRGGGVVFFLGPRVDRDAYNEALYRNGKGILPARLLDVRKAPKDNPFVLSVVADEDRGPVLPSLEGAAMGFWLGKAEFTRYVQIEKAPGARARPVLAFVPKKREGKKAAGDPALLAFPSRLGRVFLFTSSGDLSWGRLPSTLVYPILVNEMFERSAENYLRDRASPVGAVLEETLPATAVGKGATLVGPDGESVPVRLEKTADGALFRWRRTGRAGVYVLTVEGSPRQYLFAVDVPSWVPPEQTSPSDPVRLDAEALRAEYPGWKFEVKSAKR